LRVEEDPDGARSAADDADLGGVGDLLQLIGDGLGDTPEVVVAVIFAVQGDRDLRDVVDVPELDDRL